MSSGAAVSPAMAKMLVSELAREDPGEIRRTSPWHTLQQEIPQGWFCSQEQQSSCTISFFSISDLHMLVPGAWAQAEDPELRSQVASAQRRKQTPAKHTNGFQTQFHCGD